ncbi:Extracellular matrix-binding ebh, putative [Babesia ovata]|uniref:Extracellular matrix-binding ebh, putative n=1 Tax=Babesia ovata TaxID=189622 RepID=A0A2H6KJW2_9APIC|nr:Extracellular matrix-binding ebh, putative [Babesia ovata]GBE63271.1 Extracellular matrix-binding ebh, putative [Babesia ovata]
MTSPSRCFVISFFHYSPCPQSPNALLHPSFQWIKEADEAVKAAKVKAENVHGRLDHSDNNGVPKTPIGQGVKQINEAKGKVSQVDGQLKSIHSDLGKWKDAASGVLGTAVGKAQTVHGKLDPDKSKSTLGGKIGEIEDAKNNIISANSQLKSQVDSLSNWISTAEEIRQKAQQKAEEAYSKLDVHAELSKKIGDIVTANKKINEVHKNFGGHLGSLNSWKQQARTVLDGAIDRANEVYEKLDVEQTGKGDLKTQIERITSNNQAIQNANKTLGENVKNLGSWNSAAQGVIGKAEVKCDEILEKVSTTNPKGKIFENAEKLRDEGKKLLEAAKAAKDAVENNVTAALKAVVAMDTSLKMDLKKVKDKIKEGIHSVIEQLQVTKLDGLVKIDLGTLKSRIENLSSTVESSDAVTGNGFVGKQLQDLENHRKGNLDTVVTNIQEQTNVELQKNFDQHIQSPLNDKVQEVDSAIGTLGGKFVTNGNDEEKKCLQKIFEEIHKKVKEIKGSAGSKRSGQWKNNSGLDGVAERVKDLAEAFVQKGSNSFKARVEGWLEGILGMGWNNKGKGMKAVTSWLEQYQNAAKRRGHNEQALKEQVKNKIMNELNSQIGAAQGKIGAVKEGIKENLSAIVSACETFVEKLDEKIKKDAIDHLVQQIVPNIQRWMQGQSVRNFNEDADLKCAIRYTLLALCAGVKQVATEINSLGIGKFGEILDNIKPTVDKLDEALKAVTKPKQPGPSPPGNKESPAQAVDSRLEEVRNEVSTEIERKFRDEVTRDLKSAVGGLEEAVNQFDGVAQEQIRAAATTAITKAAGEISKDGVITLGGTNKLMQTFKDAYDPIKNNLHSDLKKQVDLHIGEDDPPAPAGGQGGKAGKVKIDKNNFLNYDSHVDQKSLEKVDISKTDTLESLQGQLPGEISSISTVGLKSLTELIGQPGGKAAEITKDTFDKPFTQLKTQLEAIKKLVDGERSGSSFMEGDPNEGIKDFLRNLTSMLGSSVFVDGNKGLHEITKAINNLKTGTYDPKSSEIEGAVKGIKGELERLREKLKNDANGGQDNDVIDDLSDLRDNGLGEEPGNWTTKSGSKLDGLGSITKELQTQNEKLPGETEIIDKALIEIRWELAKVRIGLDNFFHDKDILGYMEELQKKIGKDPQKQDDDSLTKIQSVISGLQSGAFSEHPNKMGEAKDEIVSELKRLQTELQGSKGDDVITTLEDLRDTGLSGEDTWNVDNRNEKGLAKIHTDLSTEQSTLNQQPQKIQGGVTQITTELDDLRNELQGKDVGEPDKRGVIRNMDDVIEKIGKDESKGLNKITKDIDSLNRETVPLVNKHLGDLCARITSEAGSVDWQLKLFKEDNIDKGLSNIKEQFNALNIRDLQEAIAMCADFLTNADYIKWEKVENIERFVDSEIEKAIAELSKQARRDYVESARDALKHFALKAESELGELPEEINRDLFMGYKGFMKYVYGQIDSLESVREEKEIAVISSAFHSFYAPVNEYVSSEIRREHREREGEKNPLLPKSQDHYADRLSAVHTALSALLTHITGAQRYGHEVRGLLDALDKALAGLRPECFARPSTAVIDGVTDGLSAFAAELRNAYISAYSGAALTGDLVSSEAVSERSVTVLTPYGEKLSKVFLSVAPILGTSLAELRLNCRSLAGQHLNRSTDLGRLLGEMGYRVPDDGEQDGELDSHVTGRGITMLLVGDYKRVFNSDKDTKNALGILLECLNDYYKACHYATLSSTRTPCSVYEMLVWLTGLKYNCVYDKLRRCIKLCYSEQTENSLYPATFPADALVDAVDTLTSHSPSILTRVLGYGSALTTYACDFHSNSMRLYYPQDGEECLHMMLHCCAPPVTAMPTPHPECTDKSPLMSYLNDCLPGHLPHQVSAIGCEPQCNTCPSGPSGMPCLTPLGFRGFSGSTKTGKGLCKVLTKLFTNAHLSSLLSLCPRPPATLAEHIGFALSLVNDWHDGSIVSKNGLQKALEASASALSLRLYKHPHQLTMALTAAYGSDSAKHGGCKHPHLTHLAGTDVCTRHQASPFLQSLCRDSYDSLAHRHSGLYLSWAVYLPWTLYDLLLCLYTAFCNISCRDWGCSDCLHEGPCDEGSHGILNPQPPEHGCHCRSTVQCRGVMPTLYQYGLAFRDASALLSQDATCSSFSTQLSNILNSEHFRDLFDRCDEFLFHIRLPFLLTLAALWLTALAYILVSLLYRMDVLRIRSHLLTTRASHLIDVKALLAGSRRMLSLYKEVDYFDDDLNS